MSKQFQVVGWWYFVSFRNLAESLYVLWALSLVECVAGAPARRKAFLLKLRKLKNILHATHFSSTISSIAKR